MRWFVVGLMLVSGAVWAQPVPMTSEDVAPLALSGTVPSPTAPALPVRVIQTPPPVGSDHIDQVLATVSATISSTTALVTSASAVTSPSLPTGLGASPTDVMSSTTSPTVMIQPQPAADVASKSTVRVTGNAGAQDRVLQVLKAMGLAASYTRLTMDGAELAVPNANGDTLAAQLRAKGMVVELGADGAVEVKF